MDIGVVFQCDPPARALVEATVRAEQAGFSHAWTFDSHVLWQEPYVIHSAMLAATSRVVVGPMVTNPATRDTTVTASTFATLAELYGGRVVCGIGRGDSAVRTISGKPVTLADLRQSVTTVQTLTGGASVVRGEADVRLPWVAPGTPPVEVWVAAYGPKALQLTGEVADGFILQLADPAIARWTIERVRAAAQDAGRDPASVRFCVAAPAYVTDGSDAQLAHAREQTRWFGGMVGNHVADIVARYGHGTADGTGDDGGVPAALTDYIKAREGYDYSQHGRAGNTHTAFVPDEIVDRFCVLGPPAAQQERLAELAELGCDQFAVYAQHDAKDAVVDAYGEHVIPSSASL